MLLRNSSEHCCAGWADWLKIIFNNEVLSEENLTVWIVV